MKIRFYCCYMNLGYRNGEKTHFFSLGIRKSKAQDSMRISSVIRTFVIHAQIHRGVGDPDLPSLKMKKKKHLGFLSNTGPDPLKPTKLPRQHSMLGHHQHTSETLLVVFGSCHIWTPSDKTFWIDACSTFVFFFAL